MSAHRAPDREQRGTIAALALAISLTIAALVVNLAAPNDPLQGANLVVVEVEAGDTWWEIADPCGDDLDKRLVIQLLQDRSHLGTELHPGDEVTTCAQAVAA